MAETNLHEILARQYRASLAMVREAVVKCPKSLWLAHFGKLELQLYNLRHLQHHTGQLIDQLRTVAQMGVGWVAAV